MNILELEYPGTWIQMDNKEKAWEIQKLLDTIKGEFTEANIALMLFQREQYNQMTGRRRSTEEVESSWERDRKRSEELMEEYHKSLGDDKYYNLYSQLSEQVDRQIKREKWEKGELPLEFQHRVIFIYAKSFIQSIDCIDKLIDVLSKDEKLPSEIKKIRSDFKKEFKHLRKVRNSEQHLEDRIRKIGPGGKQIKLKPIDNELIKTSEGAEALVINNLIGTKFGTVIDNGEYAEIDISLDTLTRVRDFIQRIINTFNWSGRKEYYPS